jgi:hypothetical protein
MLWNYIDANEQQSGKYLHSITGEGSSTLFATSSPSTRTMEDITREGLSTLFAPNLDTILLIDGAPVDALVPVTSPTHSRSSLSASPDPNYPLSAKQDFLQRLLFLKFPKQCNCRTCAPSHYYNAPYSCIIEHREDDIQVLPRQRPYIKVGFQLRLYEPLQLVNAAIQYFF